MLRPTRVTAAVLLVLGGLQLLTAPPAAADPYDTTPMSGPLPPCPSDQFTINNNNDAFANSPGGGDTVAFEPKAALGLKNNCANMNWQQPGNSSVIEQAVHTYVTPETYPINNTTQTVTFHIDGVNAPGPLNGDFPACMPRSTRAGGCTSPGGRVYIAYRLANGAGQFLGPWTLAGLAGHPNPYFDLTRRSCPTNHPEWEAGFLDQGSPCSYDLNFVTDVNGKPNLTSAMQVAVALGADSGTVTVNGHTGPEFTSSGVASMVFTPGASTSLRLAGSAATVPYGKPLTLTATAAGPPPGAQVGFYAQTGGAPATLAGTATTAADGSAVLTTSVTQSATYYAALLNGGVQTVRTTPVSVLVEPTIALKASHEDGARWTFTGKVKPELDGIKVVLQRQVGKKWKKAAKGRTKKGKVELTVTVPEGRTKYRLVVVAAPAYAAAESKVRSVTR